MRSLALWGSGVAVEETHPLVVEDVPGHAFWYAPRCCGDWAGMAGRSWPLATMSAMSWRLRGIARSRRCSGSASVCAGSISSQCVRWCSSSSTRAQSDVGVQPRYVRMASRKIYFRRGRTSVDYATWVKIPAHPVTFTEDDRPQSYKLVGTVTYHAPLGQPVPRTSGANDLAFQSHVLLVTPLVYREPTGLLGSLTGTVDGPELQFYIVG